MNQRLTTFVLLLRGVNVGGKNKIAMADLKDRLRDEGFLNVTTQGLTGNVILDSTLGAKALANRVEKLIRTSFKLDSETIMVVAIEHAAFKKVVAGAPSEFGADDALYRYYVLFLKDMTAAKAMKDIEVRPGVDMAWAGQGAIYFRLPSLASPDRNRSWLNRLIAKPLYQSVTMRNWSTTGKIMDLLEKGTNN